MGSIKYVLGIDYETYYDRKDYTLRKLSVPQYVLDDRFAVHLMAAYDLRWPAPRIIDAHEIPEFLAQYPPGETLAYAHNMLFDGAILAWKYNWVPALLQDTIGMARSLRRLQKYSLGKVAEALFGTDTKGDVIGKVSGMSILGIKQAGLWGDYRSYAMNDARLCHQIFLKLYPELPAEERLVMDLVLRAALEPTMHANIPLLQRHLAEVRAHKAQLLEKCGLERAVVMSTAQFKAALEELGVEVKTKLSATNKVVPAFAKSDPFMQDLKEYDQADDATNNLVQTMAAARLSEKSTIEETRAQRFLDIASLPWKSNGNGRERSETPLLPLPLRYGGAHTHRLSGEWSMNCQNLPRDASKSKLRTALMAPPGHVLVAADLAQIEARIVAVLCKQHDLVEQFARGEDVYSNFGSALFDMEVSRATPNERWIAKTAVLGLGYGCGAERFYRMVLTSARQFAIPLDGLLDDLEAARRVVTFYRNTFPRIPAVWSMLDRLLAMTINSGSKTHTTKWGPVTFRAGRIDLPNGMALQYARNDQTLYGARLLENISQALARIVIMQAALRLARQGYRFALQTHDELVFVVPEQQVGAAWGAVHRELIRPPEWLPELPLAAEVKVGRNYGDMRG